MGQKEKRRRDRKRERLFKEQKGLCHWCRKPMTLKRDVDNGRAKSGEVHNNFATFEHLVDGFNIHRRRKDQRIVLAHWYCNEKRAQRSEKSQPILELWYRSWGHRGLNYLPRPLMFLH